jgi:hypothetical protein
LGQNKESNATQTTLISGGAVADYNKTYVLISQNEIRVGFVPKLD